MRKTLIGLTLLPFIVTAAPADVKLAAIFGDGMVLQQDVPVRIWGWAEPGEDVTVSLGRERARVTTGGDGRWMCHLEPPNPGGPYDLTVRAGNTVRVSDVLVGEVWLCAGQSNMVMSVGETEDAFAETAAGNHPNIRMFTVSRHAAEKPQDDVAGAWVVCTPQTVGAYSAVAYYFGRALQQDLDVPIGLVNASWSRTRIEAWTRLAAQDTVADIKPVLDEWAIRIKGEHQKALSRWQRRSSKAKAAGLPLTAPPSTALATHPDDPPPATLFNSMIAPLVPFGLRGVIWYQGESNGSGVFSHVYGVQLRTLIQDLRHVWNADDLPFVFVQLPNFGARQQEPVEESGWVVVREAMLETLAVPGTGMVVTIDLGQSRTVHPANKREVGDRLARCALGMNYCRDIEYSGPIYASMQQQGAKIAVWFDHVGSGLMALGDTLRGFAIAGEDRLFVWGDARIVGDHVEVSSPLVDHPVAVRYAWAANPECTLFNWEGLPASPFRTDRW